MIAGGLYIRTAPYVRPVTYVESAENVLLSVPRCAGFGGDPLNLTGTGRRNGKLSEQSAGVTASTVRRAYKLWAPVYDQTFGIMVRAGRMKAVEHINNSSARRVLEVGVGTGLSLPHYRTDLEVTGIDLSPEMLEKAEERVRNKNLTHVDDLLVMDASRLDFPDDSFDVVVAMFVMTVVPDPNAVMKELERVCAPGGQVLLVNHFSTDKGIRGWIEQKIAAFESTGLWRPEFPIERVMVCDRLKLRETESVRPFGLFTLLSFEKIGKEGSSRGGRRSIEAASPVGSQALAGNG